MEQTIHLLQKMSVNDIWLQELQLFEQQYDSYQKNRILLNSDVKETKRNNNEEKITKTKKMKKV